jgi:hypothetical protein
MSAELNDYSQAGYDTFFEPCPPAPAKQAFEVWQVQSRGPLVFEETAKRVARAGKAVKQRRRHLNGAFFQV